MKITFALFMLQLLVGETVCLSAAQRYPNELEGYKFQAEAPWAVVVPLKSSLADVRAVLGQPRKATDLHSYFSPYPGDKQAFAPLFEYSWKADWDVYIYFVTRDQSEQPGPLHGLSGRVFSLDLIPRNRVSFVGVTFPAVFSKRHVVAADAAWDEFSDTHGLTYEVYTGRPAHGDAVKGDLNRISYGVRRDRNEHHESE